MGCGGNPGGPWWPLFPGAHWFPSLEEEQRGSAEKRLHRDWDGAALMPQWGKNSGKQAGDVFPIIPAASFGWNSSSVQGKSQGVLCQAVDLELGRVGDSP